MRTIPDWSRMLELMTLPDRNCREEHAASFTVVENVVVVATFIHICRRCRLGCGEESCLVVKGELTGGGG